MNQAFPHKNMKRGDKQCLLSEYSDKQFFIYSEQNDTFINALQSFDILLKELKHSLLKMPQQSI